MKVALSQINPRIGDFQYNVKCISDAIKSAQKNGADLAVFPELALCGYPPKDLLEFSHFVHSNEQALAEVAKLSTEIDVILGTITRNDTSRGKRLRNSAAFLSGGKVKDYYHKRLLPNYDVFDEARHFEPGDEPKIWNICGRKVGITICEDLWSNFAPIGAQYHSNPVNDLASHEVESVINLSASPFSLGKPDLRKKIFSDVAKNLKANVYFVNQVGANDDLIFDGCSFALSPDGQLRTQLPAFEIATLVEPQIVQLPSEEAEWIADALQTGIRDYFGKTGFEKAVIGLSGGIDSAVVLGLAAQALGRDRILAFSLPSRFSSPETQTDAQSLCDSLGIPLRVLSIETIFRLYESLWREWFAETLSGLTSENLQSRVRMTLLMALANRHGALVLNTSNKSEIATGYSTLYGDAAGAVGVLGDCTKSRVYAVGRFLQQTGIAIPERIFERPPSAELRPDQKDSDSLPPYDTLDGLVMDYIETPHQSLSKSADATAFARLLASSEYKRRQFPPILRITEKAFGPGRRIPIVCDPVGHQKA